MKIRIKNQNCVRAGSECRCQGRRHCGDCTPMDVTSSEVNHLRKKANEAGAGSDIFYFRCARTIEGYLSAAQKARVAQKG